MGGKRKAKKKAPFDGNAIAKEELSALESIYGDGLEVDTDRHGFCVEVIPRAVGASMRSYLPSLMYTAERGRQRRVELVSSCLSSSRGQSLRLMHPRLGR